MKRYGLISALVIVLAAFLSVPAFSQETQEKVAEDAASAVQSAASAVQPAVAAVQQSAETAAATVAAPEAEGAKDISIYGEVLAVNSAANTMSVQYYDYDSDEEKTVELGLTADTKLENAAALNDVKKGDWVDAVYTVTGGKNMAKSVIVEKEEPVTEETAAPAEGTPAPAQQ